MITGSFTVTASDNGSLVVGQSYPLSIDDSSVDVLLTTTTQVAVTAIPVSVTTPDPTSATTGGDSPDGGDSSPDATLPATE